MGGQKADSPLVVAEPGSTGRPVALFSLLALRTQQDSRRTRGLKSTRLTGAMTMPVGSRSAAILNTGSIPQGDTPVGLLTLSFYPLRCYPPGPCTL